MNQDTQDIKLAAAVLKAHLKETLDRILAAGDSEPIAPEDLFDLAEGRLDATQREELIEQLARNPVELERLGDLLAGYNHQETDSSAETAGAALPQALISLRDWVRNALDLLSPVLAYSAEGERSLDLIEYARENNLLSTLDFEALDHSFEPRAAEIRALLDAGHLSAQLLNIQAAVMEVHLVLSRDRGGSPAGFFGVWKTVSKVPSPASEADWSDAYRAIQEVYDLAIRMDETLSGPYVGAARIDLQLGDLDRAEEYLEKAASLNPSEASAYHLLAQIRNRKKK